MFEGDGKEKLARLTRTGEFLEEGIVIANAYTICTKDWLEHVTYINSFTVQPPYQRSHIIIHIPVLQIRRVRQEESESFDQDQTPSNGQKHNFNSGGLRLEYMLLTMNIHCLYLLVKKKKIQRCEIFK